MPSERRRAVSRVRRLNFEAAKLRDRAAGAVARDDGALEALVCVADWRPLVELFVTELVRVALLDGHSWREIAEAMDVPVATVHRQYQHLSQNGTTRGN